MQDLQSTTLFRAARIKSICTALDKRAVWQRYFWQQGKKEEDIYFLSIMQIMLYIRRMTVFVQHWLLAMHVICFVNLPWSAKARLRKVSLQLSYLSVFSLIKRVFRDAIENENPLNDNVYHLPHRGFMRKKSCSLPFAALFNICRFMCRKTAEFARSSK